MTDRAVPGNSTSSYRTKEPVRYVGEMVEWVGHSPEKLAAMPARVQEVRRTGSEDIDD